MVAEALFSSAKTGGKDDWGTPECVLERVRKVGPIGFDPCPLDEDPTWTGAEAVCSCDGLEYGWAIWSGLSGGLVYVNPPYSNVKEWVKKCVEEVHEGAEIVLLVPARVDTRWFQLVWDNADAVCFWRGRLKFKGAEQGAPFPSAVVYFGARYCNEGYDYRGGIGRFRAAFEDAGKVVIL